MIIGNRLTIIISAPIIGKIAPESKLINIANHQSSSTTASSYNELKVIPAVTIAAIE